jgi:integrase
MSGLEALCHVLHDHPTLCPHSRQSPHAANNGLTEEIQEECGHSSYKATMDIYGHLFES